MKDRTQDSIFARLVKLLALVGCGLCGVFTLWYHLCPRGILLTLAITAGTLGYHLVMRLTVGWLVAIFVRRPLNPDGFWFRQRSFERKLYRILRVRRWKGRMPTYDPREFSFEENTPEQIIQNSCRAELVHEWIMAASFLPIFTAIRWGAFPVFVITSILAAAFDGCFVMMQQYNRPRLQQYLKRCKTTSDRRSRS
jgi:hypothetical protein